jgi:cytochrome P450
MEGRIAFETMLRRLPDLQLAAGSVEWRPNLGLRGLVSLPVAFTPTPAGA